MIRWPGRPWGPMALRPRLPTGLPLSSTCSTGLRPLDGSLYCAPTIVTPIPATWKCGREGVTQTPGAIPICRDIFSAVWRTSHPNWRQQAGLGRANVSMSADRCRPLSGCTAQAGWSISWWAGPCRSPSGEAGRVDGVGHEDLRASGGTSAAPLHDRRSSSVHDRYRVSSHSLNQRPWAVHTDERSADFVVEDVPSSVELRWRPS